MYVMKELMKTAICNKPGEIEILEFPVPETEKDKVLVKIDICGICGSDLAVFNGSGHKKYPYSPGHEFSGVIVETGGSVPGKLKGKRVVVNPNLGCQKCEYCMVGKPNLCDYLKTRDIKSNGGLSEYVSLDCRMVHQIPDTVPDGITPFIEPLSCALYAAQLAKDKSKKQVVVFGGGIMGILTGISLQSIGCDPVFIEPSEERRNKLTEICGTIALSPQEVDNSKNKNSFAAAIDCSGNIMAASQAIRLLKKGGSLFLAGLIMNPEGYSFPFVDFTTKEIALKGVWLNPGTFAEAIKIAEEKKETLEKLTTKIYPLQEIKAAFTAALNQDVNKVLVKP